MILHFRANLNPHVTVLAPDVKYNSVAPNKFNVHVDSNNTLVRVFIKEKDPRNLPPGEDMYVELVKIDFDQLSLTQQQIYEMYEPEVQGIKTCYLGFAHPKCLHIRIQHPYNKLLKELALTGER